MKRLRRLFQTSVQRTRMKRWRSFETSIKRFEKFRNIFETSKTSKKTFKSRYSETDFDKVEPFKRYPIFKKLLPFGIKYDDLLHIQLIATVGKSISSPLRP